MTESYGEGIDNFCMTIRDVCPNSCPGPQFCEPELGVIASTVVRITGRSPEPTEYCGLQDM